LAIHFLSIDGQTAKKQYHIPSILSGVVPIAPDNYRDGTPDYPYYVPKGTFLGGIQLAHACRAGHFFDAPSSTGHLSVEAFCGTKILLWNGGEVAAAARVRGDCAVEALLRVEPTRNPALR